MPAKKKSSAPSDLPDFEKSLGELERIVATMEEDELPLEELVTRFEQGTKLLGHCQETLDSAKKRLRTIAAPTAAGEDAAENDPENPLNTGDGQPTEPIEHDDDIRLF